MPTSSRFTNDAEPRAFWGGPGKTFSEATTTAWADPGGALVRRHQHRVRSHPLLRLAVRQQPGEVLRRLRAQREGKPREAIWGQCIGCPTGPDATARDIVQYIARGQIKTLAVLRCPSEPQQQPDPEEGRLVRRRRRSSSARSPKATASLEDKVNAFFSELAKPYEFVRSGAAIDTDVAKESQFTDVPERLGVKKAA